MLRDVLGNRYVLSGLLGAGGMAEVFLAHDPILARDLALKVLRERYAEDTQFVGRFRKEAQSAAALNHPNVVQVYDQGRAEDGRYYIAMEHVPGGNLKDLILGRGPLDFAEAVRLACQVAEALRAAHGRGTVHRDVKPQNVLIDEAGDAKVADFGIALAASSTSVSATNQVFGTAAYMSPEQAMGGPVGPQSDLYSLGVVLYEMLTGSLPFAAEGPLATAMKHVTEPPLPPRKRNPSVPEGMDALVMTLLAKRPEDRYPSAAELAEDLRRAREGLPPAFAGAAGYSETVRTPAFAAAPAPGNTGSGARPGSQPSKARRRRSMVAGLVALAALLALLGGLGWDASRHLERVSAVRSADGDTLGAPERLTETPGNGAGKDTGSGTSSAVLAGGASVPASSSASAPASASASAAVPTSAPAASAPVPASAPSASAPVLASAPAESEPPVSKPRAPDRAPDRAPEPRAVAPQAPAPHAPAPFSSAPVPGGPSGSGGQDAGAGGPGGGGSAAQEQY